MGNRIYKFKFNILGIMNNITSKINFYQGNFTFNSVKLFLFGSRKITFAVPYLSKKPKTFSNKERVAVSVEILSLKLNCVSCITQKCILRSNFHTDMEKSK